MTTTNHETTAGDTGAPNLDCMPRADLIQFAVKHHSGRRAAELFPDVEPFEALRVTAALAEYARQTAYAMTHRIAGNIARALKFERRAERIYDALPEWAQW